MAGRGRDGAHADGRLPAMTRFADRDLLGRLPVAGPGEPPCLKRHPWTGYGCQAVRGHALPCRYYSDRGWHVEWYPAPQ
jgi:hypothetical protein